MKIIHFGVVKEFYAAGLSFSIPNLIKAQNLIEKEKKAYLFSIKDVLKIKLINFDNYSIFVLHSFFIPSYIKLLLYVPTDKKIIICPRGAFSISNKYSIKKSIYSMVYFGIVKLRKLNIGIHFLTENEKKRSRYHAKKEFVIGNSIELFNINEKNLIRYYQRKFISKEIIYVGRFLKHIKGLDYLFEMLKKHREEIQFHKLKFSFYGPECKDLLWLQLYSKNNNLTFVSFFPEIYGEKKAKKYNNAMFHILTSRSEGFPMSVLESTSLYTPQILSKGTNLQGSMLSCNFGMAFSDSFINEILKLNFNDYKKMCLNARQFAKNHSLQTIGKITTKAYISI